MTAMHALTQLATVDWTLREDRSEAPACGDDPRGASVAVVYVSSRVCAAHRARSTVCGSCDDLPRGGGGWGKNAGEGGERMDNGGAKQ